MTGEDLTVTFSDEAAFFALAFRQERALLDLCQARDLAAVLGGTLDGWRANVNVQYGRRSPG